MSDALGSFMSEEDVQEVVTTSEFDVAFTLDGRHDSLGSHEGGWRYLARFKKDGGDQLKGYDPLYLNSNMESEGTRARVIGDEIECMKQPGCTPIKEFYDRRAAGTIYGDNIPMRKRLTHTGDIFEALPALNPKRGCGLCVNKCAFDRYSEVPEQEEVVEDIEDLTDVTVDVRVFTFLSLSLSLSLSHTHTHTGTPKSSIL